MSLNYKILSSKPTLSRVIDGISTKYIDLLPKTFTPGDISLYRPAFIIVSKDYIARPDLISLMVYGTDDYADVICKVNNISNPFEINEDYLIMLPNPDMLSKITSSTVPSEVVTKYTSTTKELESIYAVDADNINSEHIGTKESSFKKLLSERRSPNEQTVNSNNYLINNKYGIVYY